MVNPTCEAVQQGDEMFCHQCDLRWDVNDPEPPGCREPKSELKKVGDRLVIKVEQSLPLLGYELDRGTYEIRRIAQ